MTKEFIETLPDDVLLDQYANCCGQLIFCPGSDWIKNDVEVLKAEILRRMKKN